MSGELRRWIDHNWDLDMSLGEWWQRLADAGLAFPTWPEGLGGRGWSPGRAGEVSAALADAEVIGTPTGVGQSLAGPTLVVHGSERQKEDFLPRLASGQEAWCQLFSEPGAGSDLASLRTRAVVDGKDWVVNGQKVWNSGASFAERGFLLARTDWNVPKREGITYFVIDMVQSGVETRPLKQMNGVADFDEVFFSDAAVPPDRVVGGVGAGWKVARTTLAFERSGIGGRRAGAVSFPAGERRGLRSVAVRDLLGRARQASDRRDRIEGYMLRVQMMEQIAQEMGLADDPVVRQELMRYRSMVEVNRLTAQRARAAARSGAPGPEGSIGKLAVSLIARRSRSISMRLLGAHGTLTGADAPHDGQVAHVALSSFAAGLGGGTDEIQRNILGERVLGLPREPEADQGIPFDQGPRT